MDTICGPWGSPVGIYAVQGRGTCCDCRQRSWQQEIGVGVASLSWRCIHFAVWEKCQHVGHQQARHVKQFITHLIFSFTKCVGELLLKPAVGVGEGCLVLDNVQYQGNGWFLQGAAATHS